METLSSNTIITTFTGKKVAKSSCRKIKGEFYIKGRNTIKDSGECYLVEGKWHRFNNGMIEFDHEQGCYVLVHKTALRNGVVDVAEDGEPILGYFSSNLTKNVELKSTVTSKTQSCISDEVAKRLGYREQLSTGDFYSKEEKNANFFKRVTNPPIDKRNLPYDSRFASNITREQYDNFYKPDMENINLNRFGDFLEKNEITFGLEFETTTGYIPERLCYKYGLIPLRDGSIPGLEYVTIPLSGKKGLYALKNICKELGKRTRYDLSCALHLHLGGLTRNMGEILSCYLLSYAVQNDMFALQPAYKKGGTGVKGKDYCSVLPLKQVDKKINNHNLTEEFGKFFQFVSDGRSFSSYENDLDRVHNHPSDPRGDHKWQIGSRYKWLNFVPIIFTNKKTVEFRHHSATYDFEKIINFMFTCATIVYLSKRNRTDILNRESSFFTSIESSSDKLKDLNREILKYQPSLSKIIERNDRYNVIKRKVITTMTKNNDISGSTESKFDGQIHSELGNSSFWD